MKCEICKKENYVVNTKNFLLNFVHINVMKNGKNLINLQIVNVQFVELKCI